MNEFDELYLITSMRFLLMNAASSFFILIFGILLKYIAVIYIMIFSGAVFILCGRIIYFKECTSENKIYYNQWQYPSRIR